MIAVIGSFRLPLETLDEARPMMRRVIAATLVEPGCRAYSYSEDVAAPGVIRVQELWDSRAALTTHFATPHMRRWMDQRVLLGLSQRRMTAFELGVAEEL
ncbi:MAG: putative quinol monooxygenase [Croceibacterium sp.]